MSETYYQYVLLTGADLGDRETTLSEASLLIEERIGQMVEKSSVHETEPWGFESNTKFLNQALLIRTSLKPLEILKRTQQIELELGRVKNAEQWSSRSIDIDILCSENTIFQSDLLNIPHSQLHKRSFALVPLCELTPGWKHPLLNKTYAELLREIGQLPTSAQTL